MIRQPTSAIQPTSAWYKSGENYGGVTREEESNTMAEKVKVGIVGCGVISGIYLKNLPTFEQVEVVACADLVVERAQARAAEYGIARACTPDELLADASVELVVDLTIPKAHGPVALAVVEAGKSVYNEKPLAVERAEGEHLLRRAREMGVLVGGAPDTFLGGGIQTCRQLIDEGAIGEPVAATAFMANHGHEHWHPDPAFYYQAGGGPMFDMGPYYLTALVSLMGPIDRVAGSARATFPERTISSKPKEGQTISVETPTHVAGTLDFRSGAIATVITSFDVWVHSLPRIEIYGSEGTLSVPDPNTFGGPARLRQGRETEWRDVEVTRGWTQNSRGLGVADMAHALRSGRPHRASGQLAFHVLDTMHAFLESSAAGHYVHLDSTCERPAPLPADLPAARLDD
ncbi:MAG: Dehydrogenase [uncultured Chloroflexi bacterium]|uniref:Dehydrogenase n=1 Tax=uncultured Chloroflexota bacterium TaxID=166587 RepID=A0A6J4JPQ5_9CHLR|nr:MAG: Dehydrogenase [uncultured Chloroflexota bacterium]